MVKERAEQRFPLLRPAYPVPIVVIMRCGGRDGDGGGRGGKGTPSFSFGWCNDLHTTSFFASRCPFPPLPHFLIHALRSCSSVSLAPPSLIHRMGHSLSLAFIVKPSAAVFFSIQSDASRTATRRCFCSATVFLDPFSLSAPPVFLTVALLPVPLPLFDVVYSLIPSLPADMRAIRFCVVAWRGRCLLQIFGLLRCGNSL